MKRRTREDIESRDYVCACGRAYLSYSALHTHIRKYHQVEDKMMDKAIMPPKKLQQRGRPKHKLPNNISYELEELTMFQTAILKIYDGLKDSLGEAIILQGDQQHDLSREKSDIQQILHPLYPETVLQWTSTIQEAHFTLETLSKSLTTHFKNDVAARIKAMLIAGYLQFTYQGGNRQQCMAKMQLIGWQQGSNIVVQTLYDILMRSLQRISLSGNSLTQHEE